MPRQHTAVSLIGNEVLPFWLLPIIAIARARSASAILIPCGGFIWVINSRLGGGVAVTLPPSETAMNSRGKRDVVGDIEKVDVTVIWRFVNVYGA